LVERLENGIFRYRECPTLQMVAVLRLTGKGVLFVLSFLGRKSYPVFEYRDCQEGRRTYSFHLSRRLRRRLPPMKTSFSTPAACRSTPHRAVLRRPDVWCSTCFFLPCSRANARQMLH